MQLIIFNEPSSNSVYKLVSISHQFQFPITHAMKSLSSVVLVFFKVRETNRLDSLNSALIFHPQILWAEKDTASLLTAILHR